MNYFAVSFFELVCTFCDNLEPTSSWQIAVFALPHWLCFLKPIQAETCLGGLEDLYWGELKQSWLHSLNFAVDRYPLPTAGEQVRRWLTKNANIRLLLFSAIIDSTLVTETCQHYFFEKKRSHSVRGGRGTKAFDNINKVSFIKLGLLSHSWSPCGWAYSVPRKLGKLDWDDFIEEQNKKQSRCACRKQGDTEKQSHNTAGAPIILQSIINTICLLRHNYCEGITLWEIVRVR